MTIAPPEGLPGEIEYLRLPRPAALFERRARRLRELAPGNPLQEFLEALADLADAQRAALPRIGPAAAPRELAAEVPLRAQPSWAARRSRVREATSSARGSADGDCSRWKSLR